jgi:hypothetical protein
MKLYDVIRKEQLEKKGEVIEVAAPQYTSEVTTNYTPFTTSHRRFSWKTIIVLLGSAIFIALLYIAGMKLVHARAIVTERHVPFSFDRMQLEMEEEKTAGPERLSFQVMVVSSEVTRQVYASSLQQSNTKASGSIVVFNEYSTKAITLKKGTTVTATSGKKYITQASVIVPGYTTVSKLKKAGTSPQVLVTAADVGESYNAEGTSFTVSGYNSKQLYARSSGAITGGEAGIAHVLTDADRESAILTLQADLAEKLKRETRAAIKDEFVTFPNLQFITIDRDSLTIKGNDIKFPASIKGTMVSYLIHRDMLEAAIASKIVSDHVYPDVSIPALGDITVEPISAIPTDATKVPDTLTISLSGSGTLITKVPVEKIKQAVLGIPRKSFSEKLQTIPEIDEARYTLYPFWAPFFPSSEDRITVIVK